MSATLLSLAGIDEQVLAATKNQESRGFAACGVIIICFFVLSFLSANYLLSYLVHDPLLDALIALAYASIVFNFYRFNLSSIIWRSKDFKNLEEVHSPSLLTTVLRMAACGFFIVIMSKPLELFLFHNGVSRRLATGGERLYENFHVLHHFFPGTWIITLVMLVIFIWPIWFRSFVKRWGNREYEVLHYGCLMLLIKTQHEIFCCQYNAVFEALKIKAAYRTHYANAPFNTELKAVVVNTKDKALEQGTNKDFYNYLDKMPIVE